MNFKLKLKFWPVACFLSVVGYGQIQQSFQAPEPSKVYEFTKYDQTPTGEYTGIPNIAVPLHNLQVDDVSVPLTLQYHAGGIRVTDEASNVGLGWNLNFGILTQTINGWDDLDPSKTKRLLKYQDTPVISEWPATCATMSAFGPFVNGCPYVTCNPEPQYLDGTPQATNSIFIANDYSFIFPGQSYCFQDLNYASYDMEPDLFRVNFLGHSFKFIKRFIGTGQGEIILLDASGYKVELLNNDNSDYVIVGTRYWKITAPDGTQYYFAHGNSTDTSSTRAFDPLQGNYSGGHSYSKNWVLVKIVTTKKKAVNFLYTDFGDCNTSSSISQSYIKIMNYIDYGNSGWSQLLKGISQIVVNANQVYTPISTSVSTERLLYVSQIITPQETASFSYSAREDRANDKKLDAITIANTQAAIIKQFSLAYGYFVSPASGNVAQAPNIPQGSYTFSDPAKLKRLKLLSVTQSGMSPYVFTYNSTLLPVKISTAVDYWGFYNGKTTNISLAPNPAVVGYANIGSIANDKRAFLSFTKACTLEEIRFPTGGTATYEYELQEYTKGPYEISLPNWDGSTGIIKGGGLRVKSVSMKDFAILQKKTNYSYSGGKNITPFKMLVSYTTQQAQSFGAGSTSSSQFDVYEFSGNNYVQPSLVGSYNAIGYDEVTIEQISAENSGKTILKFMNVRDITPHATDTQGIISQGKMSLPSRTDINTTQNGKLLSEEIIDKFNNPVTKKELSYTTRKSSIFYGNKISQFRSLIGLYNPALGTGNYEMVVKPQFLVGYYAIYGKRSLLTYTKTTNYHSNGNIIENDYTTFNSRDIPYEKRKTDGAGTEISKELISFAADAQSNYLDRNMLTLPSSVITYKNGSNTSATYYQYQTLSDVTVNTEIKNYPLGNPNPIYTQKVTYELHDDIGNVLQYYMESNIKNCVIWGYNKTLPIAHVRNATYSEVSAYVANLQSLSNVGSEASLKTALNNLRTALPNAQVTTFTHKPGVGVLSVTDEKGCEKNYTFDAVNRLQSIKDCDGKLLSSFEYNMRP